MSLDGVGDIVGLILFVMPVDWLQDRCTVSYGVNRDVVVIVEIWKGVALPPNDSLERSALKMVRDDPVIFTLSLILSLSSAMKLPTCQAV